MATHKAIAKAYLPTLPQQIYLLADHLDAVLAAGEDLLGAGTGWQLATAIEGEAIAAARDAQRTVIERVRTLEVAILARVLKVRQSAADLGARDPRFRQIASLFVAGTAILQDAVADAADATQLDFETGDTPAAYLLARGLIAGDATALDINDGFLLVERIELGALLDLSAQFLDTLELHYELFPDRLPEAESSAA